ncbi:MAG: acetate--CoA ligase [Candidatus Bathyarchaeia archaeon]
MVVDTAHGHSKGVLEAAYVKNRDEVHKRALEDPDGFWGEVARELEWFKPWSKVCEWKYPWAEWFVGGKCNIAYNALDRHVKTWRKNKVAIFWEGEDFTSRIITYYELNVNVNKFANSLKALGIRKGDRVSIYLPRTPEQIIAMLACARIGAVHNVVYSGFSSGALQERVNDSEARIIITADGGLYRGKRVQLKKIVDEIKPNCPTVEHVIVVERLKGGERLASGGLSWSDLISKASPRSECEAMDATDPLYILYTSGTTGKPKGVVHVHGGYMVGVYITTKWVHNLTDDDVFWCTADPGWVTGHSYITYGPLLNGATQVFYEGAPDAPDPGRWWSIIERYGVTNLYTTPTAIRGLMRFGEGWPKKHDLSSLRMLGTVGEPINPEAWLWYRRVTGDRCPIMDTWWQTETGMQLITPLPSMPLKPGSACKPFPGIVADVVDKEGKPVPPDKGGFLVIKTPWPAMMRTIYKDPQRYESYWNIIPNVYTTGDVAHKDADGYFWIMGRMDDVIKTAGYRIGSAEVESALVSHPAVAEAAAIGRPDPIKGEVIKTFVALRQGQTGDDKLKEELKKHVRNVLGPIAVPAEIEFTTWLPKTRSGKIMRRVLRAKELNLPVGDLSTLEE